MTSDIETMESDDKIHEEIHNSEDKDYDENDFYMDVIYYLSLG